MDIRDLSTAKGRNPWDDPHILEEKGACHEETILAGSRFIGRPIHRTRKG